jgi:hypothetical protein
LIKPGGATTGGNKIIGKSFARLATVAQSLVALHRSACTPAQSHFATERMAIRPRESGPECCHTDETSMVDVMRRRIQGRRRRGERQCSAPLRLRRQFHLP